MNAAAAREREKESQREKCNQCAAVVRHTIKMLRSTFLRSFCGRITVFSFLFSSFFMSAGCLLCIRSYQGRRWYIWTGHVCVCECLLIMSMTINYLRVIIVIRTANKKELWENAAKNGRRRRRKIRRRRSTHIHIQSIGLLNANFLFSFSIVCVCVTADFIPRAIRNSFTISKFFRRLNMRAMPSVAKRKKGKQTM